MKSAIKSSGLQYEDLLSLKCFKILQQIFNFPFKDLVRSEVPSIQKGAGLQMLTTECLFASPRRRVRISSVPSSQQAAHIVFFIFYPPPPPSALKYLTVRAVQAHKMGV